MSGAQKRTTGPIETCEVFDVVVVPFPFTDSSKKRRRPALVLSKPEFSGEIGHIVLAMITSAHHSRWPLDVVLQDLEAAGLKAPSLARMKLFTLDQRFVGRRTGALSPVDRRAVKASLKRLLP